MASSTSTGKVVVTGHNRESTGRVVHYLRPEDKFSGSLEFQGGVYVTDEKGILEDGAIISLNIVATVTTGKAGSGG